MIIVAMILVALRAATLPPTQGDGIITRPNTAGAYPIGMLYDARSDLPVSGLLCDTEVLEKHTTEAKTPFLNQEIAYDDSIASKSKLVGADMSFMLSIITGAFNLEASAAAHYMNDKARTSNTVRLSYSATIHTYTKMLDVFHPEVVGHMNHDLISTGLGTHVVTQIIMGAVNIAMFNSEYYQESKREEISAFVATKIKTTAFRMKTNISAYYESDKFQETFSLSSVFYGDTLPGPGEDLPQSADELLEYVKGTHKRMNDSSVPVLYVMTPLASLDSEAAQLIGDIQEHIIVQASDVYDKLMYTNTLINDLETMDPMGNYAWVGRATRYKKAFMTEQAKFLQKLGQAVVDRRWGKIADSAIPELLEYYWKHPVLSIYTAEEACRKLRDEIINHQTIIGRLEASGVEVARTFSDMTSPLLDPLNQRVYVLVLVDNGGRSGVQTINAFLDYAASKYNADDDLHCDFVYPEGSPVAKCRELLKFVVVHHNSFCNDICPSRYCFMHNRTKAAEGPCPTKLNSDGRGEPGACHIHPDKANQNSCWLRDAVEADTGDFTFTPFTHDWCSCPSTMAVEFLSDGVEREASLDLLPPAPTIAEVTGFDNYDPSGATDQTVSMRINPEYKERHTPYSAPHRFRVSIVWQYYDAQTKVWHDTEKEFETHMPDLDIPVIGLSAGRRYHFSVAGVNNVGVGPFSVPYPLGSLVKVSDNKPMLTLHAPSGAVAGLLPSWDMGRKETIDVDVHLSAQMNSLINTIAFESTVDDGEKVECSRYSDISFDFARCTVSLRELVRLRHNGNLLVKVYGVGDGGKALGASGTVRVAMPSIHNCMLFEEPSSALLCEARITGVSLAGLRHNPKDQRVALQISADADYDRGHDFRGWVVETTTVNGLVQIHEFLGNPTTLIVKGLVAGETYLYKLAAKSSEGATSFTHPFPPTGHTVSHPMPIVTPAAHPANLGEVLNNAIPSWRYNNSMFFAHITLSVNSTSRIRHVIFSAPGTNHTVNCVLYTRRTTEDVACVIPMHRFTDEFAAGVGVNVTDRDGLMLAHGSIGRIEASEQTCFEWEATKHKHCTIPESSVSKCVRTCDECRFNNVTTVEYRESCTTDICSGEDIFCPGEDCIERDRGASDNGCSAYCATDSIYDEATDTCAVPCEPIRKVSVPPGETFLLACPTDSIYTTEYDARELLCPSDNRQRFTHSEEDRPASWLQPLPDCEECTVALHCNGHAVSTAPDYNQTACTCACLTGYTGDRCEECIPGYFFKGSECVKCSSLGACNGRASSAVLTDDVCTCTCDHPFSGEWCDECETGFYHYGYPYCNVCPDCNGHANSTFDPVTKTCTCTCSDAYAGESCDRCAPGYGLYPHCYDEFEVTGNGCPEGTKPLKHFWPAQHHLCTINANWHPADRRPSCVRSWRCGSWPSRGSCYGTVSHNGAPTKTVCT